MSLFDKVAQKSAVVAKSTEERKPSEFFINLGFKKVYGEGEDAVERFVQIPLFITADNIQQGIERTRKNCSANSPEEWLEFIQDQITLGEDLVALFSEIGEGQSIVNKDIPEDHELSYFANLQVQFVHKDMHKAPVVSKPTDVKARRASFK